MNMKKIASLPGNSRRANAYADNEATSSCPAITLKDTIKGFKMIVEGELDHLPEQAFYMVGSIEEAIEKAKTLQ